MAEGKIEGEDRISELPEDLLVKILLLVPTKVLVMTMFLSKRWLSIWTMVPRLEYIDEDDAEEGKKSVWGFLDKSMQHHNAPVIHSLCMELGSRCPTDVDVGKWVVKAVDRQVVELTFMLFWTAGPTRLPECLYTCETLVDLTLGHKILVDLSSSSSSPCLPSLRVLQLYFVVYKDEDSLCKLLSSCPDLEILVVGRNNDDNVKNFTVKVPSLWRFSYKGTDDEGHTSRCVVMDTPALEQFEIFDSCEDYFSVNYMPCLEDAYFNVKSYPDDKLLRSSSSVLSLHLCLNDETLMCCSAIKFSRLTKLKIHPCKSDWLEPLMLLLGNSPKLRHLMVDYEHRELPKGYRDQSNDLPLSWNQPSCVPGCLSSQLEIFEWIEYGDKKEEKEFLQYILLHSKHLKTATIHLRPTLVLEEIKEYFSRVSTTCEVNFVQIKE